MVDRRAVLDDELLAGRRRLVGVVRVVAAGEEDDRVRLEGAVRLIDGDLVYS